MRTIWRQNLYVRASAINWTDKFEFQFEFEAEFE